MGQMNACKAGVIIKSRPRFFVYFPAMLLRAVSACCFLLAAASALPVNTDGELVLMTNSIHHADVRACEQLRT